MLQEWLICGIFSEQNNLELSFAFTNVKMLIQNYIGKL